MSLKRPWKNRRRPARPDIPAYGGREITAQEITAQEITAQPVPLATRPSDMMGHHLMTSSPSPAWAVPGT
ncbi:hypothetical protein ACGF0J_20630 [Nonomuraea sp. NPDC047897]|uniref:hypothetical protein n=1 Tax=Nonomuraea sp. NPDC047897 TaxID=3364346 RepID=UPI00372120C4